MNRNDMLKQQTELRAAMEAAHKANDHAKFNELLAKHNAIDADLAKLSEDDERAAKLRELEDRAEKPQGRVAAPAGATQPSQAEVRASKDYEERIVKWVKQSRQGNVDTRALSLYSDPDGGFTLAPSRIEQEIIKPVKNVTVVKELAKYELLDGTLSSQGLNLSGVTGNSQKGYVVDLTTESTTGETFSFSQRRMMSHPFTNWCKIPNPLIDFAGFDILGFITQEIKERKDVKDDYRFWYGTGVEEPLGMLVDHADGIPASTRDVVGCASGVLTYAKLWNIFMNQKPQHRGFSTWVFDTTGIKQIMSMVGSDGQPLPGLGLFRGDMPTLFGRPMYETNNISPTLSSGVFANSQYVGIFGNMKRYSILESKRVSMKLDPFRLSDENVTICYLYTWLDGMPQQAEAFTRIISS